MSTKKTPAQRAQEALDAAEKLVKRLTTRRDKLSADLDNVTTELTEAERLRDHAATHPHLPEKADQEGNEPASVSSLPHVGGPPEAKP